MGAGFARLEGGQIVRDELGLEIAVLQDPLAGCVGADEYLRIKARQAARAAQHRADLGLAPEVPDDPADPMRRR